MGFSVRGHICIRRKAKDGTNGQSSFKSIVFIRTNDTPSTPTGGSYTTPVPTGWSDGVPSGTAKLWMSTRIFTSDGLPPQQSVWTTPQQATDDIDIDFEYSAVATNPGTPTNNPSNWHKTATENDIWMAVRKYKNGTWGSWEICKIKGEDGRDGTNGTNGTNGTDGAPGRTIRTTVWVPGKQYYCGDTQVDGVYPLDIVSDKAISIGESGVNFYMCRTSHTSSANIPLTNTAYWTKLNNLKPVVTYLILAELIKANYIDVQDLATNNAFINNLYVKHLSGADGDFSGTVTAQQGEIAGTLKIGEDGELSTDAQLGSTHNRVKLDNDGIKFTSSDSVHGSTSYDTELKKTGLSIGYIRHYTGINIDGEMNIGYGAITRIDNTEQETEYALFANGSYRLAIVSSLPSTTDSSTIYIVTGTSKGVYVGSTKIA